MVLGETLRLCVPAAANPNLRACTALTRDPRALRSPWPGSPDGREALKGDVVVSLRRGVATRGFAPVAVAEPFPVADLLALAQSPVRAEALLTARLVGKHGQGPSGKVLLRLVRLSFACRLALPLHAPDRYRRAVCRGRRAVRRGGADF